AEPTYTQLEGVPEMVGGVAAFAVVHRTAARTNRAAETLDFDIGLSGRSTNFREHAHHARLRVAGTRVSQGKLERREVRQTGFTRTAVENRPPRQPRYPCALPSARRGPEALRHRLSTVLPLFDGTQCAEPARHDISGRPASNPGGFRQGS